MHLGPVSFSACLAIAPIALFAQQQASLGVGAGVVRYAGGSSFSALTLAPAAQRFTTATYLGASGAVSWLEGGAAALQGRGDIWAALPWRARGTRIAISSTLAASWRSDGIGSASGLMVFEAARSNFALGAGVISGVIEHEPGVEALRLRARGWWQADPTPVQLSLTTEATHLLGVWYTDVMGGLTYDGSRTVASMWVTGRFSGTYGSAGAASASLLYFVTPTIAVEAAGGNYLRDPFQGLPRAGFVSGGIRLFSARRAMAVTTAPARVVLQPLVAIPRGGDTVVVRFRMPGAQSVAIAGSWNDWKPDKLTGLGGDIWERALRLPRGTYYFNLVVDGREWVVPSGIATISDGMGGQIAVLNVL